MNNGVLKITTKLIKKDFTKGINEMEKEAQKVTADLAESGEATAAMSEGLGASIGAFAKIAALALVVLGTIKLISSAIKNLVENNEEISAKVERIKTAFLNLADGITNAVATFIEPIFTKILDTIYTLLGYINAITQAWGGFSIFTQRADKTMKSTAKSAKEIKNALAGFDTANVLNNSETGGTGGATSGAAPITFPEVEIPEWVNWIIDHKDLVIGAIEGIAIALGLVFGNIPLLIGGAIALLVTFWKPLKEFFLGIGNWLNEHLLKPIGDLVVGIVNKFKEIIVGVKTIFTTLINMFADLVTKIKTLFKNIASSIANVFVSVFKSVFNGLMKTLELLLNTPINAINKLLDKINTIPGVSLTKLNTFSLPRLAKGGIVNNPGAGVMMGSYVAGEKGAEAVIPLTDDTLQRLANMIPITIDMTNRLDSRVLSRNLIEVQKENKFIRNGV